MCIKYRYVYTRDWTESASDGQVYICILYARVYVVIRGPAVYLYKGGCGCPANIRRRFITNSLPAVLYARAPQYSQSVETRRVVFAISAVDERAHYNNKFIIIRHIRTPPTSRGEYMRRNIITYCTARRVYNNNIIVYSNRMYARSNRNVHVHYNRPRVIEGNQANRLCVHASSF